MHRWIGCMCLYWLVVLFAVNVEACPYVNIGRGFYTFGPECQFQCHCKQNSDRCDVSTGACNEACERGWTGPGCQYKNLAFLKTVDGSVARDLSKVTDGYYSTCSSPSNPVFEPVVRVSLASEIYVSEVVVTFKNYTEVAGFRVYTGFNTILDQSTLCNTDTGSDVTGNTAHVTCRRRIRSRYVTIKVHESSVLLDVCEVEIVSGRLMSYKKPTNASSEEKPSGNAVNGDPRDHFGTLLQSDPWWYVDLVDPVAIELIEIVTRFDLKQFFIGFQILFSDTPVFTEAELVYTNMDTMNSLPEVVYIPIDNRVTRYVWVFIAGDLNRLHMREFNVFGGCRDHRCGLVCNSLCFCKDKVQSMSTEIAGLCRDGCERNWRHLDGFCNTSACGRNAFGYECRYSCNCDGQCDPWTGACLDHSSGCRRHFYGQNCQAENMIRDSASTIQGVGSNYQAAPASVDGLLNICAPALSGQAPNWLVSLDNERNVSNVIIHVNASSTGSGLEVLTETNDDVMPCDAVRTAEGKFIGRCQNKEATHLRIRTRNSLQICEVAVLGCSDGTFGPTCESVCQCYNFQPCNKVTGTCPPGGCEAGYQGRTCDSECSQGYYGYNCTQTCGHCNGGSACDIFTGDCELPCEPGWQGGRCDMECRNGTYGADCTRSCGFCLNREPCNKATGVCEMGCNPGYYGDNCTLECTPGSFGYNCNETCGNCSLGEVCDPIEGTCRSGCMLGLQPPLCKLECNFGTHGKDCKKECGHCRSNQTCDPYTGICESGCDTGVFVSTSEPRCNIVCSDGLYGYNCSETCLKDVCAGSDVCDKKTGACLTGCLHPGFQSPYCTSVCCDGTYGLACSQMCGMCQGRRPCNKITGVCPAGCEEGFVGDLCKTFEPGLSGVSIFLLVFGCILAVLGVIGIFIGLWIYKRGTLPWAGIQMRRKEKNLRGESAGRNFSIVSRVYDNITSEGEIEKVKRNNSSVSVEKLAATKPRGTLAVEEFWDYVQDKKTSRPEMVQQFKDLAVGLIHPCEVAKKAQNLRKNRYKEIFAYDHSRVKLDALPGDSGNDYINACYISGYNKPHMYIAAQGPTEEFVGDFWRMIWQKKCRRIVMLTRLVEHNKVKCCQYWPDEGQKSYGGVTVEIKDVDTFADFSIRTFAISADGKEERSVKHYHFESWPDRHVPEYASSVVHFWSRIRYSDLSDPRPILVHCSAGIGRTGTYLALDYLVDQANVEGYVNVFQCAQNLRHQRVNMIQNQDQYVFLYEALVEALFCPSTALPWDQFISAYKKTMELDPVTKKPKLELEYEKLQHVTKFHESIKPSFYETGDYKAARSSENAEKNRSKTILPSDTNRPYLITRVQDRNDYINAVFLPSYREDKAFLITQSPLADTIVDFWRMVYENKVTTIVNFDRITNPSEIYWPIVGETVTFIPFQLHFVTEDDHVTHVERTIKLTNAEEPREKAVLIKQFECKFWMTDARVPFGGESSLLAVYEHAQKWQAANGNPTLVVHCHNGATKSGLFCVVASTLERLKQEKNVALQQTLKQMRINRHQIIPTFEQYKFCHDVVSDFLRGYDSFSNFYI